jgi:AraC-like DNA-binding protein
MTLQVSLTQASYPFLGSVRLNTIDKAATCRIVRPLQQWRLRRVAAYVGERIGSQITLQDMAAAAGLSRMYFAAQFRAATGMRPHEYLLRRRIDLAVSLLADDSASLVEVALAVGFQTQAHFTTVFRRFVARTPQQWRREHQKGTAQRSDNPMPAR